MSGLGGERNKEVQSTKAPKIVNWNRSEREFLIIPDSKFIQFLASTLQWNFRTLIGRIFARENFYNCVIF